MSETGNQERTNIYKRIESGDPFSTDASVSEILLGYIGADQVIYKIRWQEGVPIGRVDSEGRVYRNTAHDERELGTFTTDGIVRSHGLFEGGELGWLEPDGAVLQAGLILSEEEVGRVEGPHTQAAAAALLLLFLPDDLEMSKRNW